MAACTHPRTGTVTSHPARDRYDGRIATTPVCPLPECLAEAFAWVQRMSGRPAVYVLDSEVSS